MQPDEDPKPGRPNGGETVLPAGDEDYVRTLFAVVLHSQGYRVLEARDGLDALEVCERHGGPIDLLATDVSMPRLGGRALVERLRVQLPGVRVLYLSGYGDAYDAPCLQKPFAPADLAGKVREVLAR